MANSPEDMDKRRKRREEQLRRRRKQLRRLRLGMAAALVVLGICCCVIYYFIQNAPQGQMVQSGAVPAATEPATEAPTEETRSRFDPITTVHIRAAGDLNITDSVVDSGLAANGYDYTRAFQDVASTLSSADLTIMNLEGNVCGEPYGTAPPPPPIKSSTP